MIPPICKPYLSVIIPAYNEEARIEATLNKIIAYLKAKGWTYEIIVVDDGSTDKTLSCIASFENIVIFKNERNKGKGYSVRRGVLEAKGEYILFSDADLSTPISELDKFLKEIEENDIVIGCRASGESQILIHQPWWREGMGRVFNFLVQVFVIKGFKDTQCGFKLFKKEPSKRIFSLSRINGFAFDVEIVFIAKKMGFKIKDVPVVWINSKETRVNPITAPLKMLIELVKIRCNDIRKMYKPYVND